MADSTPLLTVIIPTRERPETLKYAVQTAMAQNNPHVEILISDNFSGPAVKEVADDAASKDSRVRYVRAPERLGMSEHWEFAVSQIRGDWVTIIGDDDGLLPGAVDKFVALTKRHPNIKAITTGICRFHWPHEGQNNGKLSLVSGKGYEVRNGLEVIKTTMSGKRIAMPTIYTGGFVHKDVIAAVKAKNPEGRFFMSMLPDIYSGFAVCSVVGEYIYSYESLAIAGSAPNSNSAQYKGRTKAEMEKLAFHKESGISFHPSLDGSSVESMQVVLYESFLQTQNLRNDDFGVTLQQQLEVSLLNTTKRVREAVRTYCKTVADKNGLDFAKIEQRVEAQRKLHSLKKLGRKFSDRVLRTSKLPKKNIDDNSVRTIYDAAVKCGGMLG